MATTYMQYVLGAVESGKTPVSEERWNQIATARKNRGRTNGADQHEEADQGSLVEAALRAAVGSGDQDMVAQLVQFLQERGGRVQTGNKTVSVKPTKRAQPGSARLSGTFPKDAKDGDRPHSRQSITFDVSDRDGLLQAVASAGITVLDYSTMQAVA